MLLDHLSVIEDPRELWRVAHPLPEVLLLVVCGTLADCDDYEGIAEWGETHLSFLRRFLPCHHGVLVARWLTLLMNRIDPDLFAAAFTAWVRESSPDRLDLVAIDGKTSRRSHHRGAGKAPLHLVSAFATTRRLVLGQEAVADKSSETTAIPLLIERLAAAEAVRSHWAIENSLHWVLDVTFGDDQSRLRKGHGARNMAVVRHFACRPPRPSGRGVGE